MWHRRNKREDKATEVDGDQPPPAKKRRGWTLNIAPPPDDPNAYEICDNVKFRQPMQVGFDNFTQYVN